MILVNQVHGFHSRFPLAGLFFVMLKMVWRACFQNSVFLIFAMTQKKLATSTISSAEGGKDMIPGIRNRTDLGRITAILQLDLKLAHLIPQTARTRVQELGSATIGHSQYWLAMSHRRPWADTTSHMWDSFLSLSLFLSFCLFVLFMCVWVFLCVFVVVFCFSGVAGVQEASWDE